jgi:hypothetical protein
MFVSGATFALSAARTEKRGLVFRLASTEKALEESKAVIDFMLDVFRKPDPQKDGRSVTAAELLNNAVDRVNTEMAERPYTQAELQREIGRTYMSLGLTNEGIQLFEARLAYFHETFGASHFRTKDAAQELVTALITAERFDDAGRTVEKIIDDSFRKQLKTQVDLATVRGTSDDELKRQVE